MDQQTVVCGVNIYSPGYRSVLYSGLKRSKCFQIKTTLANTENYTYFNLMTCKMKSQHMLSLAKPQHNQESFSTLRTDHVVILILLRWTCEEDLTLVKRSILSFSPFTEWKLLAKLFICLMNLNNAEFTSPLSKSCMCWRLYLWVIYCPADLHTFSYCNRLVIKPNCHNAVRCWINLRILLLQVMF